MTAHSALSPPTDVHLLLRSHAQQHWLSREVIPVLRQLEKRDLPEEQLGAAYAYLEVLWIEASRRAAETDAACAQLDAACTDAEEPLREKVRRYHLAVRNMHESLSRHITKLLATASGDFTYHQAGF